MQSTKYPGWMITKEQRQGRTEWTLIHTSNIYAIAVYECKQGYLAELMTKRTWAGHTSWEPCRNSAEGIPADVITEAERRLRVIQKSGVAESY